MNNNHNNKPTVSKTSYQSYTDRDTQRQTHTQVYNSLRTLEFKRTVYGSTRMEKNCFILQFFNFLQHTSAETVNCIVLHTHTQTSKLNITHKQV